MATFTGTSANEAILPGLLSPTVISSNGLPPGNEADLINAFGGNDTVGGGQGNDSGQLAVGVLTTSVVEAASPNRKHVVGSLRSKMVVIPSPVSSSTAPSGCVCK